MPVERASHGDVEHPGAANVERLIPGCGKTVRAWARAQPIGAGPRHADGARRLSH